VEEIGGCVFDALVEMAPNLRGLFPKPRGLMADKLVNIIGLLASLADNPAELAATMRDVGTRHVNYHVASHHLPVMCRAVLLTLEMVLGLQWTTETARAWEALFDAAILAMGQAIDEAQEQGAQMQGLWDSVLSKMSRHRFATLLYSRLIRKCPDLVPVFVHCSHTHNDPHHFENHHQNNPNDSQKGLNQANGRGGSGGELFVTVLDHGTKFGSTIPVDSGDLDSLSSAQRPSAARVAFSARHASGTTHVVGDSASLSSLCDSASGAASESQSTRPGIKSKRRSCIEDFGTPSAAHTLHGQGGTHKDHCDKKSRFANVMETLERVTGFDLDGDGTVAGDIVCEDEDLDVIGLSSRTGGKTRFSRTAWGEEILDLVGISISLMYQPELQSQKLIVIASRFHHYGLRTKHLKPLGEEIENVLRDALVELGLPPWSSSDSDAWLWFWGRVESPLMNALKASELDYAGTARAGWTKILATLTTEAFGNLFYEEMQRSVPELLGLFVRPKALQNASFVQIMATLVNFLEDPEEFYAQVKPLVIRHIKYGVKAEYIQRLSCVTTCVLRSALGDNLTPEAEAAWSYAWGSVSRCLAESLANGTNLVTIALVGGDVQELERALAIAPRGQRADWVTRVQIHDSFVSPVYWAIKDGELEIARVMLRDLLAIKVDRDAFYYGRDRLWELHPDIVTLLCSVCPDLLEELLDGLIWHSASAKEGKVRVNYYVRELYGNPDMFHDASTTPFAILALQGPAELFVHPVVEKVLHLKWTLFARARFLAMEFW